MPELPEVELTMRVLQPRLIGKRLIEFWCDWARGLKSPIKPEKISREVEGLKIKDLKRRGKVLFMNLDSPMGLSFAIHLKMSGALLFGRARKLSSQAHKKHIHFIWRFEGEEELWLRDVRKFGMVWYGTKEELAKDKYLSSLGPDALTVTFEEFLMRLRKHHGQLKPLLLCQDVIAGLGNITVDETLWAAKLHPKTLTENLSLEKFKRLYASMRAVLKRVIKAEGNTMRDWILPNGRAGRAVLKWKAYGREGRPCLRCGRKIRRIIVGSRGTYFCPNCKIP